MEKKELTMFENMIHNFLGTFLEEKAPFLKSNLESLFPIKLTIKPEINLTINLNKA